MLLVLVDNNGSNQVDFVYLNENTFETDEKVIFEESNVTSTISSVVPGDKDIADNFELDPGQRSDYLDFSAIVRKSGSESPTRRLKIVYNHFVIEDLTWDFVTVNSYDRSVYTFGIPFVDGRPVTDIIDLRPRSTSVSSGYSPFEFMQEFMTHFRLLLPM